MAQQSILSRSTFLNPSYAPPGSDPEKVREGYATDITILAHGLTMTALLALENETSGVAMERRGIAQTLEVAGAILADLMDQTELLERKAKT